MKHNRITIACMLAPGIFALTVNAHAAITEFSASGTTGTFQTGYSVLYSISGTGGLSGTGNTYNYNSQFFTPGSTGTYTFGTSKANFDTVLIFYTGSYNPANPTTNVVALNDDSSGAQSGRGLVNAGTCSTASYCSQLTANLTQGVNYYLVTTTYDAGTGITGTVWYYVDGVAAVGVGGAAAPSSTSVYSSSLAMRNNPALNAARVIDANSNLAVLFSGLSGNNNISNSASQTLPLLTGSSVNAAKDVMRDISRIVQARLASNSGMSTGDSFEGNKNVWMKPFGSMADQNDINGVSGYKANTYGLAFGADAAVTKALRIGGAFAYAKSDINGESSIAPQSAQVDMYNLLAYGSYSLDDRTEINFQAGIGQNDNRGRRQIALTSSLATSNYNSDTANFGVGIGRTYKLSSETTLTPSVRVDYTWIKDQGYLESGAGLLNLNVNGRTTDALILGVDGKLSHQLNDRVSLIANLGIGYDTINKQASITSAFAGAPGAAFVTYGIDPSPWLTHAGVGAVYTTKSGLEIGARYDAEFRESFLNQTASIKARWSF
jgi:outer membrane autotransporter protein